MSTAPVRVAQLSREERREALIAPPKGYRWDGVTKSALRRSESSPTTTPPGSVVQGTTSCPLRGITRRRPGWPGSSTPTRSPEPSVYRMSCSPSRDPPVTTTCAGSTCMPRARRRCSAMAALSSGSPVLSRLAPSALRASLQALRHAAGRTAPALPADGRNDTRGRGVVLGRVSRCGPCAGGASVSAGWIRVGAPCAARRKPSLMSWS